MDKRFTNIFGLTQEQAITLLKTPPEKLEDASDRYIAASHLMNFSTPESIEALLEAVKRDDPNLDNRIVRRKAVESLGRLQALEAIPTIRSCLADDDCYLVENSVWALGEIGTEDEAILEEVSKLLEKPGQNYRVIIHTLANLNYQSALDRIRQYTTSEDKPTASAAIAAVCRFSGDYSQIGEVIDLLQHQKVNARRACLQDLIDSGYYGAIPDISRCPVSVVFRLRAIYMMAEAGIKQEKITFKDIQPDLERALLDNPDRIDLVHEYDVTPVLSFVIEELYNTDFGRCYLATKTLVDTYPQEAPKALLESYLQKGHNDYGAHYHILKTLGWLNYAPAYNLFIENLHNNAPQFQKSRTACALALGELGDRKAIPELKKCLETKIWSLKYAALMALEKLGDTSAKDIAVNDQHWLIKGKIASLSCHEMI
ncbi:MAG: HEAT repeat domain-containing protein [Cyanobacteria bacterium P01_A01_bin.84]